MPIYLDHAATSPMPAFVASAYLEALQVVGNPASIHSQGQNAKRMLEEARERVAASLGADSVEVTFTGGGTEAVNLAIKGLWWSREGRNRILVPEGEHHATIDAVEWLATQGAVIDWVPIDANGRIDLEVLAAKLGPDVALVTAIWANNEVGTIEPVREIAALAAAHGVPVHLDAIAAYGYVPIDFHALGVAALSVSAHKIGGPVGIGALLIARSATVVPLLHGGNQQRARSGTQDAAGAVAFGVAASALDIAGHAARLSVLRDRLVAGIRSAVPSAVYRGDPIDRLPGNAHFTFPGCEGDSLLFLLDVAGFSVSTGSACQAGVPEASHVLLSMGLSEADARGALRFTLGPTTTQAEVDALVAALPDAVARASRAGLADRETTLGR
ncbi:cysteine desulfurase family protein [soil metagenome]